jgi:prevent-host-death family protein
MKRIPLSEMKDDLNKYLQMAQDEPIVVTRYGKPAGVIIGFDVEDDWADYEIENDPRFMERVLKAHKPIEPDELEA